MMFHLVSFNVFDFCHCVIFSGVTLLFVCFTLQAICKYSSILPGLCSDVQVTCEYITKTCLYNFDPLIPHFYKVKLGFTGVYIIFLISAQKRRLWVLVRTASLRRF